jgi:hypothetical protein
MIIVYSSEYLRCLRCQILALLQPLGIVDEELVSSEIIQELFPSEAECQTTYGGILL